MVGRGGVCQFQFIITSLFFMHYLKAEQLVVVFLSAFPNPLKGFLMGAGNYSYINLEDPNVPIVSPFLYFPLSLFLMFLVFD